MSSNHNGNQLGPRRVLLFSERNIYDQVAWRCPFYEFEGILQEIDSVDLLAPKPGKWHRYRKSVACRAGEYLKTPLNPGIPRIKPDKYYDMFFAVCEKPSELLNINAVKEWKDYCKTSVCWVAEFFVKHIPVFKSSLEVLSQFDHVIFMLGGNEPFRRILGEKGCYMPAGIDALRFCPYPNPPKRSIDVLSIGRRSEDTHQALLKTAKKDGLFYVYDTRDSLRVQNLEEHRMLLANQAKRSRYFTANPGKIDAPEETGGQSVFGHRHFEGAASGTIMIGERPNSREFESIFNWDDAVVDLPFGSDKIVELINELDRQPERQMSIRRNNIVQSLLRHDWVYRWEDVLQMAGLEPLPALLERKERLERLAGVVAEKQIEP